MEVTVIFDIGKTNKKFYVFDRGLKIIHQQSLHFEDTIDEDGFPCEDIQAVSKWVTGTWNEFRNRKDFRVSNINFSAYGASLVHLDKDGNVLTPLYNYLKPYPANLLRDFYDRHGPVETFSRQTSSPPLGMLNSGLQLYWLKKTKPDVFRKIRVSLHLPQYFHFLLTGIPFNEYTSLGCHTGLWDFEKTGYHKWVLEERIETKFPPIAPANSYVEIKENDEKIKVGIGIHDSSAALIPYLQTIKDPFVLLSTGTWSISLNLFNQTPLTSQDFEKDCLHYMTMDGQTIKASRLFLGNEHALQVKILEKHFQKRPGFHKEIKLDKSLVSKLTNQFIPSFRFKSITGKHSVDQADVDRFHSYEEAYHQMMIELTELQYHSTQWIISKSGVNTLIIDGGFAGNEIFTQLMASHFNKFNLFTVNNPVGSALGAAMVISSDAVPDDFTESHYQLKRVTPSI